MECNGVDCYGGCGCGCYCCCVRVVVDCCGGGSKTVGDGGGG